jgi:hypothetical protein
MSNTREQRSAYRILVGNTREQRSAYRILVGNPAGNRPLERPKRGWEDNIKMFLKENAGTAWSVLIWFMVWTIGGLL